MKRLVVAFIDGARRGSRVAECEGASPSKTEFQSEARRAMVAEGLMTADEGDRAQFVVQD